MIRTVARPIQINLVKHRQKKGMECCDGRGQRSIDDIAECGGPKEKFTMSSLLCFLLINVLIKVNFKWHNCYLYNY